MSDRLRLADLLSGLSIVADLGYGLPIETALRSCLIGTVLARRMDLSDREVADVFYVSLLFHVGCVAYAHETFELFGDDQAVRRAAVETDFTDVRDIFATLIPEATRGLPPVARVRGAMRMVLTGRSFGKAHDQASCEVARSVSRRIGLPDSVSNSLHDIHEWWNGAGARSLRGEQISRPARIARVAAETSELLSLGGCDVVDALRHRARKSLDPVVVNELACASGAVIAEATSGDPRLQVLDAEPWPVIQIGEADLPRIARAFGELADLKNPFTHGHAANVTDLSLATAERLGLDRRTSACLEIAAYLHDVGRIGVSNRIWAKAGTLTIAEWEQVHLHAYHSERILASTAVFQPMARIAGMHHERIDGSGYHRGCPGKDIDIAARVLGCADAFEAMTHHRPHRPALEPARARDELLRDARAGRLDSEVVAAVLDVSHFTKVRPQHLRPGGLSDREVQVLRLIGEGCSNPEIGRRLGISRRTAEHHVQHIYDKIGVSTRAAAVLFAVEHDFLRRP
jgi:HD-GYP domain-containing protein (c-di-GMP phosphodiesterase class II)/DNA-binding CsgD family transcriptional regulator